jgi:protein-disulfide isomerase
MKITRALLINSLIAAVGFVYLIDPNSLPGRTIRGWLDGLNAKRVIRALPESLYTSNLILGDTASSVAIVEFVDYQCQYCEKSHKLLKPYIENGDVSVIVKHFPLPNHPKAEEAAMAAYCAAAFGKGQSAHSLLLASDDWEERADWKGFANEIKIPAVETFLECVRSEAAADAIGNDARLATALGVAVTPTYVIQRRLHRGVIDIDQVREIGKQIRR